tara:strand:+ start:109 stop:405 length:297 start_codon:yes stop_codon:yes gene_type:complete
MGRYKDMPIKIGENKKRVGMSIIHPPIPRTIEDIYIRTAPGERLDILSRRYYGNVQYWWIIAEANAIGKGTMYVPNGTLLRIPANHLEIESIFREANK